jgi:hypothetical protein
LRSRRQLLDKNPAQCTIFNEPVYQTPAARFELGERVVTDCFAFDFSYLNAQAAHLSTGHNFADARAASCREIFFKTVAEMRWPGARFCLLSQTTALPLERGAARSLKREIADRFCALAGRAPGFHLWTA